MAQRMESVASPGGVMLSASTARLVEGAAVWASRVGSDQGRRRAGGRPSPAGHGRSASTRSAAPSRIWWSAVGDCPPSKACWIAQSTARALWSAWSGRRASARAVWCAESVGDGRRRASRCSPPSASRTPARSPSMPWRDCCARPLGDRSRRCRPPGTECAHRFPTPTLRMCCCFDDLLGIRRPGCGAARHRSRRASTAVDRAGQCASLAREAPAVYVVEDAHWIDEVSESMLADFLTVIPQTPSLALVTYRPEYRGRTHADTRCADDSPCAAD